MRRILSSLCVTLLMLGGAASAGAGDASQTMRIGVLADMSSVYAAIGGPGSIVAAQMAVDDFGGKLLNQNVEVVGVDHQNKPDVASAVVRNWVENENVIAIADNATSSTALAVQALMKDLKKATVLTSGAGSVALVEDQCSPAGVLWTWNTRSTAKSTAAAALNEGKKKWFFITADYAFGHGLQAEAEAVVKANGGEIVGSVRHPLNSADFSSYLLQASNSGADIIALANAGADMVNTMKQAREFGLGTGDQSVTALISFMPDIHAVGLEAAQGLLVAQNFVWNRTPETRAWSERFKAKQGVMPSDVQIGVYSSVSHFLKAAQAAGTVDPVKVVEKMQELPVNDVFATNGTVRKDGLMTHELYLVQVKSPAESKEPWDYFEIKRPVTVEEAYWPLEQSKCYLVNN